MCLLYVCVCVCVGNDLNSDAHVCMTGTLLTEPSPQLFTCFLFVSFYDTYEYVVYVHVCACLHVCGYTCILMAEADVRSLS